MTTNPPPKVTEVTNPRQTVPSPFIDLVPMLMCADVQASIGFYTDVLGFEVTGRDDDVGASGFAALANGRARLMLASPAYVPKAAKVDGQYAQANYYFYVDDAEGLRQAVLDRGWQATACVKRFYGLLEFEVVDPDGHVLLFGQDLLEAPD